MTEFISSFWFNQLLPPWKSDGARGWVFVIEVPHEDVQGYLDREFNLAAPDRAPYYYEAFPGRTFGILRFIDHPCFYSGKATEEGRNRIQHKELTWTFPAYRHPVTKDNLVHRDTAVVWIQPFSFDNNSYFMFSSREVLGNETQMAVIDSQEAKGGPGLRVDVGVQGMRKFKPSATSHKIGAFAIEVDNKAKTEDGQKIIESSPDLDRFIGTLSGSVNFAPPPEAEGTLQTGGVSPFAVFQGAIQDTVKQFRDVFDWDVAAYRALVSSRLRYTDVKDPKFYDGKYIDIRLMWSDSLKETFTSFFSVEAPESPPEQEDAVPGYGGGWGDNRIGYPLGKELPKDDLIDWQMPSVKLDVALAISFTANAEISAEGTLFTYGHDGAHAG
ncbi:hypothetical protein [Qipengyuania aquimaris]|uniref:Uncharacterized protein n=1 Tax=Qipengyuania aquimaris TaxID=255984 RepID=A0A9Q3S1X7_9SPHN|nr:hypothetical protein [Qipengyuania aquimaris]MBY6218451.1 hypothetical protein [Qipengyuania aquimaris]